MNESAVVCRDLRRVYRGGRNRPDVVALAGIDLDVAAGTVYGVLGPNGAGKTTTIRILSTLLSATSGSAHVLGVDVLRNPKAVRRSIGLVLGGERGLFPRLTGRENLEYFAGLHGLGGTVAGHRIESVLEAVSLVDVGDRRVEQFSRGMRQRLHLARGLLNHPRVLFLDEPTIGLDPESAEELRSLIPRLTASGVTVLLTTHYMAEADALCDRVAVISGGLVLAEGTPEQIKRSFARVEVVDITTSKAGQDDADRLGKLPGVRRVALKHDEGSTRLTVQLDVGADIRDEIDLVFADRPDTHVASRSPTLEEAYLSLF